MVKLKRIDIREGNLEALINAACEVMAVDGHTLTSTFVQGNDLILIFVKS